jgi:hypothetical protein
MDGTKLFQFITRPICEPTIFIFLILSLLPAGGDKFLPRRLE